MKEERGYQTEIREKLHRFYQGGGKSAIVQMATGAGKTFTFAMFIKDVIEQGAKVLILTDREELHDGSAQALVDLRIHPFMIDARSKKLNISHSVYVAMSQTLKRRIRNPDYLFWIQNTFDYIVIDECHKEEFNTFFEQKAFGNAKILGVSATPRRTGKSRQLAKDYQIIINGPTIEKLIDAKWLSVPFYIEADLDIHSEGFRTTKINGEMDFLEEDVARAMDVSKVYDGLVKIMKNDVPNMVTIIFCPNSENTIKTCLELNEAGIPAKYFISDTKVEKAKILHDKYKLIHSGNRTQIKKDWKAGKFKVLVNNSIFTTGFDYPEIEVVVLNRSTMSLNLFLQMCGRGSRVIPNVKESFTIVDMADNISRLKPWHIHRDYSLKHVEGTKGAPPLKKCPKCKQECYASAKKCDNILPDTFERCNFTFPTTDKKTIEVGFKVTAYNDLTWRDLTIEMKKQMTMQELEDFRQRNKMPKGWTRYVAIETNRMNEFEQFTKALA